MECAGTPLGPTSGSGAGSDLLSSSAGFGSPVTELAFVAQTKTGIRLRIHLQPRALRCAVVGRHGDALKVSVTAMPVDGHANEALIGFLAMTLLVRRSNVRIIAGLSSRLKLVEVDGVTVEAGKALDPRQAKRR